MNGQTAATSMPLFGAYANWLRLVHPVMSPAEISAAIDKRIEWDEFLMSMEAP